MFVGGPDYGTPGYGVAGSVSDSDSLKSFIRGFQPLDGLGRVIFMTTFADGFSDIYATSGVTPVSTPGAAYVGPIVARVNLAAGDYDEVYKPIATSIDQRVGLECAIGSIGPNAYPRLRIISGGNGINGRELSVRLNMSSEYFEVLETGGVWTQTTLRVQAAETTFYKRIKLVVDRSTQSYVRLLIEGLALDLSSYVPPSYANANRLYTQFSLRYDKVDDFDIMWLGSFLVTADEP